MKAFITGITGQDGAYLAQLLLEKGYEVYGGIRRSASGSQWRLDYLNIKDQIKFVDFELTEAECSKRIAKDIQPNEWYNLAAMSFVANSFKTPHSTLEMDAGGIIHQLEAIKEITPETKFYQASTSELFGKVQETPQRETTPFYPRSPYGIAKLAAYWYVRNYREAYNLFATNGILFNHESALRGEEFVTKKVVKHITRYMSGLTNKPLELGNIDSQRDWGYAGDYVKAMHLMLQQDHPDDFVISTGETHTVRELVEEAFSFFGKKVTWEGECEKEVGTVDGKIAVKINPKFYRPSDVELLIGDSSKARQTLNWKPEYTFKTLVEKMMKDEKCMCTGENK